MSASEDLLVASHKFPGDFQVLELLLVKSQTGGSDEIEACVLEAEIWKWVIKKQFVTRPEQLNHLSLLLLANIIRVS